LVGIPGLGAAGAPGVGGFASRATMSGRGGTIGLAAGCPARFGFAGGRNGLPPPTAPAAPGARVAPGAMGLMGAGPGLGVGMLGTAAAGIEAGRGTPGAGGGGIFGNSPRSAGRGWRGPERICPGLGAGTGLAGIADPRSTVGMDGAVGVVKAGAAAMGVAAGGAAG
jgi:hypothetical protein